MWTQKPCDQIDNKKQLLIIQKQKQVQITYKHKYLHHFLDHKQTLFCLFISPIVVDL